MSRCRGGPSSPAAGKPLNPNHSREHVGFKQPESHVRVFPLSVGPQGPTPLPGEEREPSPNPERRNPGSSVGSRKLFRDQDPPGVRFCPSTSHPRRQPLPPTVAAPAAVVQGWSNSGCCSEVLWGLGTAASQQGVASNAIRVSRASVCQAPGQGPGLRLGAAGPGLEAALPISAPLRPLSCLELAVIPWQVPLTRQAPGCRSMTLKLQKGKIMCRQIAHAHVLSPSPAPKSQRGQSWQ